VTAIESHHLEPGFIYSTPQPSDTTHQPTQSWYRLPASVPYCVAAVLTILVQGKQHGSLARAGKVKSQTPKVEKQEKKKTPKGRAKKRLLYNRRFVTVANQRPGAKRRVRFIACLFALYSLSCDVCRVWWCGWLRCGSLGWRLMVDESCTYNCIEWCGEGIDGFDVVVKS